MSHPIGNGRDNCLTCGIRFSATVEIKNSATSHLTTDPNSGNGQCTWCVSKKITIPDGQTPLISHKKACLGCSGDLPSNRHKYCGGCLVAKQSEYQRNYQREYRRSGRRKFPKKKVHTKMCIYSKCGREFETTRLTVKTCSTTCSLLRSKERETHAYRYNRNREQVTV